MVAVTIAVTVAVAVAIAVTVSQMESHVVIHNGIDTVVSHTYILSEDKNEACKRSTTTLHNQ